MRVSRTVYYMISMFVGALGTAGTGLVLGFGGVWHWIAIGVIGVLVFLLARYVLEIEYDE